MALNGTKYNRNSKYVLSDEIIYVDEDLICQTKLINFHLYIISNFHILYVRKLRPSSSETIPTWLP